MLECLRNNEIEKEKGKWKSNIRRHVASIMYISCQNNNNMWTSFYDINIYLRMGSPAPGVPPKSIKRKRKKKLNPDRKFFVRK